MTCAGRFQVARTRTGIAGSGLNLYDDLEFKEPYTMRPNLNLTKATLTGALAVCFLASTP